jgi:hypothetical protein
VMVLGRLDEYRKLPRHLGQVPHLQQHWHPNSQNFCARLDNSCTVSASVVNSRLSVTENAHTTLSWLEQTQTYRLRKLRRVDKEHAQTR